MSEINCNVIKDLLPSYIDEICSEDSGKLVRKHVAECSACRNLLEMMTATELVSEETGGRQIDYMKKVRQTYTRKNRISFGLLAACLAAGVFIEMNSHRFAAIDLYYCYIMMPVIMAGAYLMMPGGNITGKHAKWEPVVGGIGIVLILYCSIFRFAASYGVNGVTYSVRGVAEGTGLFGIAPDKLGIFFHRQFLAIILLQVVFLLAAIVDSLKTGVFHGILVDIHATGACLAFAFDLLLRRLTTPEQFRQMWEKSFLVLLAEGVIIAVAVVLFGRRRSR
ncbi:MAG: zf-HC2 domain-containing protein [Clostridium sp.]|nr:zf-HC2 domain-containing protein [Clostridium sp.]